MQKPTLVQTTVLLSFALLCRGQAASDKGECRDRPVCVEMGVPSIWSLQQAHYLLERNRVLNRSLRAKPLDQLDPNAANSTRIDILRQFLGVSGEFNQKQLIDNQVARGQREKQLASKAGNDARVRQLRARRDQLAADRADERYQLAILKNNPNAKDEAVAKQAEIDHTSAEIDIVNQQITDLGTVTVDALNVSNTEAAAAGAPDKLSGAALSQDNLMKLMAPLVGKEASLAASTILDNNLSLQYEIIAKQLTLLRDEAGPSRSVIFLELPQSIYTANSKGNDYIVRTKWKVEGLFVQAPLSLKPGSEDRAPLDICAILNLSLNLPKDRGGKRDLQEDQRPNLETAMRLKDNCAPSYLFKEPVRDSTLSPSKLLMDLGNLKVGEVPHARLVAIAKIKRDEAVKKDLLPEYVYVKSSESLAKSVELIPSKSYITVNDFQASIRAKNLMFVLKSLFGFGLHLDYQSQKEAYETFLSQEVHASAMGKGTGTFGWVFGPEPGKKHINPGVRTTYAVLWVPSDAHAIHLTREYCYFKRNSTNIDDPGKCFTPENNDSFIAIPHATEGFYLQKVYYNSVAAGQTATVYLHGEDFSPQISVLVDGQPLARAISLGDPRLASEQNLPAAPAPPPGAQFYGEYEVVNPNLIVLRLSSSADVPSGSPEISLVAPNKALSINRLKVFAAGDNLTTLTNAHPMFEGAFHLTDAKLDSRDANNKVKFLLLGGPFDKEDVISVNSADKFNATPISPTHRIIEFARPDGFNWTVFVTSVLGKRPVTQSISMTDPLAPDLDKYSTETLPDAEHPKSLKLTLKGSHFYASRPPSLKGAASCSAGDNDWSDIDVQPIVSNDGKSVTIAIATPPKCVQVKYQTHANDTKKDWPLKIQRPGDDDKWKKASAKLTSD